LRGAHGLDRNSHQNIPGFLKVSVSENFFSSDERCFQSDQSEQAQDGPDFWAVNDLAGDEMDEFVQKKARALAQLYRFLNSLQRSSGAQFRGQRGPRREQSPRRTVACGPRARNKTDSSRVVLRESEAAVMAIVVFAASDSEGDKQ
jgi:hypothetical protein